MLRPKIVQKIKDRKKEYDFLFLFKVKFEIVFTTTIIYKSIFICKFSYVIVLNR